MLSPKIRVIARDGNEFMRYNSHVKSHEGYSPGRTLSCPRLWSDAVRNNQFRHTSDRFTIRGIRRDGIQTRRYEINTINSFHKPHSY